ncbi:MAG: nitrogenase cofactor biosynthesis protein NifB [Methanomassiliicoccales archaeon]|jgi:nitrogen fixation protein NifB|nr:nitrogenase cofactor biosynthesis protein NifB [Methanomassiliicoccales archaeon]
MEQEREQKIEKMLEMHPCYAEAAHQKCARMHLPVAPRCNIQCNYCNRRYDCANESRPGVTSEILTPEQAVQKVRYVKERIPNLTVIGIAGPGDPLANEETFKTLDLIHNEFPDLTLCLSTNGLLLPRYVERLRSLGVRFITVTINAVDPQIASKIYDFISYDGKIWRGLDAAKILVENQLKGVEMASKAGMLVKVNTVMIPGINDTHIPEVAKKAKEIGAYIVNIIPLIPVPGTKFANLTAPTPRERKLLQDMCETEIRQMRHCRFCRADAIGLLDQDRSAEFAHITCGTQLPERGIVSVQMEGKTKYKIAVASSDGSNVDTHFGHTDRFLVYDVEGNLITPAGEIRVDPMMEVPMFGKSHATKIERIADALKGFDMVLASQFGDRAIEALERRGIVAMKERGDIRNAIMRATRRLIEERSKLFE